jgi:hypothetical protein
MYSSPLKAPIPKTLATMAIHAHLHGEALPAVSILLDFLLRAVTIRTLDLASKMQSVMKYHMFWQNPLVYPREILGFSQKGI